MNSSSRSRKPIVSCSSLLFNIASVKRSMLKTTSSFFARAQVRMFSASSRLVAKIVDATPERMAHRRLELLERHVRLAIAVLPVAAHLASGVADPGAVVDEDGGADGTDLRCDERLHEIAWHAGGRAREVAEPESAS